PKRTSRHAYGVGRHPSPPGYGDVGRFRQVRRMCSLRDVLSFPDAAALEGVPSAFAATRDGIDALLRDRGLRRSAPRTTAESLLRGAAATARLEGSDTDLETLRAGGGDAIAAAAVR